MDHRATGTIWPRDPNRSLLGPHRACCVVFPEREPHLRRAVIPSKHRAKR